MSILDGIVLPFKEQVHNLFMLDKQMAAVAKSAFYHLQLTAS